MERIVAIRRTRLNRTIKKRVDRQNDCLDVLNFYITYMSVYKARFGGKPAILLCVLIVPASDMVKRVWDGGSN